jgi:mycofactocin glycosyltransferase
MAAPPTATVARKLHAVDLPADFRVTLDCAREGNLLYGGDPFVKVVLTDEQARALDRLQERVGEHGALARGLTERNLAQPVPPPHTEPVSFVIPVKDRPELLERLLGHLSGDVIVVDDASGDPRIQQRATIVLPRRSGPGAARNAGIARARHALVACLDADVLPEPGWLDHVLPHFADPAVEMVAPCVDTPHPPAKVIPNGRVHYVPGAALVLRRHLRFDETLWGGEDVDLAWRAHTRYEPAARVHHGPVALTRHIAYGRHAAPLARKHAGPRPLAVSPWTAAAWAAAILRLPKTALAITATAAALTQDPHAIPIAAGGTLRAWPSVADALTREYWPLALAVPRLRPALLAALLTKRDPRTVAYGLGVWLGCLEHGSLDALLPRLGYRFRTLTGDELSRINGS